MKMGKKNFCNRVENTVGKGEIACHKQFLLIPQCFQKTSTADTKKSGLVWERVKKVFCSFIYLQPFKCNIASDSLNRTV